MIIHSYFTEGYLEWAKLFLSSLVWSNKHLLNDISIILSSRNIGDIQINELKKIYPDITVLNRNLAYEQMAKRAKVSKEMLLEYKRRVETVKVDSESKVWKLMIAAEDRLKEIRNILGANKHPILHVDIDTYVTKDITPIMKTVKEHDFTTRWRIDKQIKRDGYVKYENRATLISVQGYGGNQNSIDFLDRWISHLCKVPASERPTGYGQTSCYRAYLDFKNFMSFGDVPPEFLSPQGYGNGILWGANKGAKSDTLKVYQKHFRENI